MEMRELMEAHSIHVITVLPFLARAVGIEPTYLGLEVPVQHLAARRGYHS